MHLNFEKKTPESLCKGNPFTLKLLCGEVKDLKAYALKLFTSPHRSPYVMGLPLYIILDESF
jgi:hypothetical protein